MLRKKRKKKKKKKKGPGRSKIEHLSTTKGLGRSKIEDLSRGEKEEEEERTGKV